LTMLRPPLTPTLFPYTTLFRSVTTVLTEKVPHSLQSNVLYATAYSEQGVPISQHWPTATANNGKGTSVKHGKNRDAALPEIHIIDRKSTRLNSSHLGISYAVFC